MHKRVIILSIFLLLFTMVSCYEPLGDESSVGAIIPPPASNAPFAGKWSVVEEMSAEGNTGDGWASRIGTNLQFVEDSLLFDDGIWEDVSYKIKKVNINDYLSTKNIVFDVSAELVASEKNEIIIAYSSGKYLGEFMVICDNEMIFFLQDKALILNKISDKTDVFQGSGKSRPMVDEDSNGKQSGILLGLRTGKEGEQTYKTLFIAYERNFLHPILLSENIFFPRTSGFWELTIKDLWKDGKKGNVLEAKNVAIKVADPEDDSELVEEEIAGKSVSFIGNDYLSIEKDWGKSKTLQVLPVDNLGIKSGIKITDLVDDKGLAIFLETRENAVKSISGDRIVMERQDDYLGNFGINRKEGHWVLQGRINYIKGNDTVSFDFNLNTSLPSKLISYDGLVLNWYKIRDAVPDAVDGFTSPNKDVAIVVTKNKMQIFKIESGQLSLKPLGEVWLPEDTDIIMAEWAVNAYVENWEQAFLSYGAQVVDGRL